MTGSSPRAHVASGAAGHRSSMSTEVRRHQGGQKHSILPCCSSALWSTDSDLTDNIVLLFYTKAVGEEEVRQHQVRKLLERHINKLENPWAARAVLLYDG